MTKLMKTSLAALTAISAIAATATPAAAEGRWGHDGGWNRGGDRWEHRGGGDAGALIAGGIAGLALGAALSSHHDGYGGGYGYGRSGYGYGYGYGDHYGYGYGYGDRYRDYDGYRTCYTRRTVWDPYYGDYVVRPVRYPC